jgi:predicted outer membrane repeat protein
MKRKFLSFIFSLTLLLAFVDTQPVLADSAVVGTGSPASCTEAALNAALAELYPGATAPGGLLSFNCGTNPHTIVVTGEKFLHDGTVVDGGGLITLSGGNSTRIFFVTQQARVELRHIRLINGFSAGGGAIFVEPNFSGDYTYLTLDDVTLSNNNSTTFGGAIGAQHASLSITNSHFTGNSSNGGGGAISLNEGMLTMIASEVLGNTSELAGGTGGGLDVWSATLDIQTTTLRSNSALVAAGGAISLRFCSGTIASSLIDQNTANDFGGGLYQSNGSVTLSQVTITSNTAPHGGGITNDNSTLVLDGATNLTNNTSNTGGGVYNFNGQVTAQNIQLLNNQAAYGGGLYNQNGTLSLADVTLSGNSATSGGGGLYNNGVTTLTRATLALNTSGDGGAVFNTDAANLTLTNSTLSENQANFGGGVFNTGTLSLTNVTIAKNSALGGGGGILHNSGAATHLAMVNTLFSANTAFAPNSNQCLLYEAPESQLFSLWQGVSCGSSTANGNQPNTDILLAPLGFSSVILPTELTMTHAFLPLSPAKDAGTCGNGAPTTDQRGATRPQGAACDIGSYEEKVAIFADVPTTYWANTFIERLYNNGITGGCSASPLMYCPEATVTRAQMAVFLLVAEHGTGYTPPPASGLFNDVPASNGFAKWIEQLYNEGITGGCGGGNYCPNAPVTREQMAVFLMVAKYGSGYNPPAASGVFADVPADNGFAPWIEALYAEGITGGCGGGDYCPKRTVTRAQMAVFLVAAFNLP